jgi:polysaccharide biosynthesis/export protein
MKVLPRKLRLALILLGFAGAPTPATAQSPDTTRQGAQGLGDVLRPGDVIKVNVWREPEWSGEFTVDESGTAILPRIGPVHVTAMSPDSLKRFVTDSLGKFLRNPSIEVTPLRRIQVLGAVRNPGLYPVPPTVTVGDAVAVAGGATSDGKPDQVVLRRNGQDLKVKLARETRLADTPIQTGDQLYVPQRSWLGRNIVAAGLTATTTLIVALLIR